MNGGNYPGQSAASGRVPWAALSSYKELVDEVLAIEEALFAATPRHFGAKTNFLKRN
jgi:hypothetical protein